MENQPRPSHCPSLLLAVCKNRGGRPGPFYHMNDISVYLSRRDKMPKAMDPVFNAPYVASYILFKDSDYYMVFIVFLIKGLVHGLLPVCKE